MTGFAWRVAGKQGRQESRSSVGWAGQPQSRAGAAQKQVRNLASQQRMRVRTAFGIGAVAVFLRGTSGAEALVFSVGLMRGLKPPPPSGHAFSKTTSPERRRMRGVNLCGWRSSFWRASSRSWARLFLWQLCGGGSLLWSTWCHGTSLRRSCRGHRLRRRRRGSSRR